MGYPNLEEIDKVLGLVSLKNIDGKHVSQYSIGMKQRLAIARAILTRPEILILDEPINGLDPDGIIEIRRLIQELNKEHGITVIISSHILSEMELLADTVGIMKDGNMIQEISMKDIHEQNAAYIEIETDNAEKAGYILDEILQIKQFRVISDGIIQVFDLSKSGKEISSALMKYGIGVESIQKKQNSLEEFFFKTTRRSLA
jgi:ABC-2 type transport system ATP-binding protein